MKRGRVDVITLGCSKNLVDSEKLMRQFQEEGLTVYCDAQVPQGEFVVINTCGFIGDAQEESVNMILECVQLKQQGRIGKLYVMGCLAEKYRKQLFEQIPEVDAWYGKFDWNGLLPEIGKTWHAELDNERCITTPQHYAYLKIAEGCSRGCAYCAIPLMTGPYRSRRMEDVLDEAHRLVAQGVKEIQLIAQDLTFYGNDSCHRSMIAELVERLSEIEGVEWIRLHYGYPNSFPFDLLRVMRERKNVCAYLDLALQHISDNVLKRMRRNITAAETRELLARIREEVPGIHLRTTLMVGFPGETEQDYSELVDFVREQKFERMGAFAYSEIEGTYSAIHYRDDVPEEEKQYRLSKLMKLQENISFDFNQTKLGKTFKTIIDRREGDWYVGRTEFDSPEVDPEILIPTAGRRLLRGHFYNVQVTQAEAFDLYGEIVDNKHHN